MKYIKEFSCMCLLCEPEGSLQVGGKNMYVLRLRSTSLHLGSCRISVIETALKIKENQSSKRVVEEWPRLQCFRFSNRELASDGNRQFVH
jgi:hypothetical protein